MGTVILLSTSILYDDRYLTICVKKPGVVSEESGMPQLLSEALGGSFYCVHRLDKAVGGVMVYAKDPRTAASLSRMTAERKLEKHYLAIVPDGLEADAGVMEDLLFRDREKNKSYVVKRMRRGVKDAKLEYSVLEKHEGMALVKIRLHTGRSHQIRCQFSSRRCPIVGDSKYGSSVKDNNIALWSAQLAFIHPVNGRRLELSALPQGNLWESFEYISKTQG